MDPRRRGAIYRSFAMMPRSCAVGGVARHYRGETFLLLFQNLHRYALYGALFLLVCLWWEDLSAFFRDGRFGIGVGTRASMQILQSVESRRDPAVRSR